MKARTIGKDIERGFLKQRHSHSGRGYRATPLPLGRTMMGNIKMNHGEAHPHEAHNNKLLGMNAMNSKSAMGPIMTATKKAHHRQERVNTSLSVFGLSPMPEHANGKDRRAFNKLEEHDGTQPLQIIVKQPLEAANGSSLYDVFCAALGGGLAGQTNAMRRGISKALVETQPDLTPVLKQYRLLFRGARVVERKKPSLVKARRRFQFTKR